MGNGTEQYLKQLEAFGPLPGARREWLRRLRARAAEQFTSLGFPTTRQEDWKYTNVSPVTRLKFVPAPGRDLELSGLRTALATSLDAYRLVLVNGWFVPSLSSRDLPRGVVATGLGTALERGDDVLESHLGRLAPLDTHAFAALNTASLADGAFVHLHANAVVDKPLHVLHIQADGDAFVQSRCLIIAGEGSKCTIVEQYVGLDGAQYFTNAVTEIMAEKGAQVEHYRLQQEAEKALHIGGLYLQLARDSRIVTHALDLGGLLVRNDLHTRLEAEGAECVLNGMYLVGGRQHLDNHTRIDHLKPRGTSREFYKGVLDGRSRAVFTGRVVVHPDAQHSDAEQVNNNLLLSRDAEVDTQPQLEIYADDVKCSHGATVGQLDADALFYLRSRGLDQENAQDLLTYAFANDVLQRVRLAPVRSELEQQLATRLLHGRRLTELAQS